MNDTQAIERTLAGDVDAFAHLASRYQGKVFVVALSRVYDHQDAQDLTQETFLRAYTRLPSLSKPEAFAPWLFTILRRLAVDFLRGKLRMKERERTMGSVEAVSDAADDPRDTIAARDTANNLWKLVSQLDDKSREVVCLYYGQQMTVPGISALTGVNESAVKMRLSRARTKLGERTSCLGIAWGVAPLPLLSTNIAASVKVAGPLAGSAVAATGSVLGGIFAWMALFGWLPRRDVDRWKGKVSADARSEAKRRFMLAAVLPLVAVFVAPTVVALTGHLGLAGVLIMVFVSVLIMIFCVPLLVSAFLREIALLPPRDKTKQVVNMGLLVPFFASMILAPQLFPVVFGLFMALQFFFVNKSNVALATVTPGFWVTSLLKNVGDLPAPPASVQMLRIHDWLAWLHVNGLVAPPRTKDGNTVTVRLRLRPGLFEKMTRSGYSTLRIETSGRVTCTVIPRDYVALMATFLDDELPPRRDLAEKIGASFTRALAAFQQGASEGEAIKALGLADCPIDVRKTTILKVQKYVLPAIGVAVMVGAVFYLLK